jgi:hypothetical protein
MWYDISEEEKASQKVVPPRSLFGRNIDVDAYSEKTLFKTLKAV